MSPTRAKRPVESSGSSCIATDEPAASLGVLRRAADERKEREKRDGCDDERHADESGGYGAGAQALGRFAHGISSRSETNDVELLRERIGKSTARCDGRFREASDGTRTPADGRGSTVQATADERGPTARASEEGEAGPATSGWRSERIGRIGRIAPGRRARPASGKDGSASGSFARESRR